MPYILACAGGSLGHLAPLVAVCRAIHARDPTVRIAVACAEKERELAFLRREGFAPIALPSTRSPLGFLRTLRRSFALLEKHSPSVVFGKGGAVSIPLCLAARWKRISVVIHESDAVMGRANRFLSHFADVVCLGFPGAAGGKRLATSDEKLAASFPLPANRYVVTGNPVRPEILAGSRAEGLRITGFSGARPILLVIGGSQGAQAINDAVLGMLSPLTSLCDVIHLTGPGKFSAFRFPLSASHSYWNTEFASDALPHLYATATIAISRGGAGVLSELAAWRIPAIVVPLEGLAQNHQRANAAAFAASGGAILLSQEELLCLPSILHKLLSQSDVLPRMSSAMAGLSHPDAAQCIAEVLLKVARRGEPR